MHTVCQNCQHLEPYPTGAVVTYILRPCPAGCGKLALAPAAFTMAEAQQAITYLDQVLRGVKPDLTVKAADLLNGKRRYDKKTPDTAA